MGRLQASKYQSRLLVSEAGACAARSSLDIFVSSFLGIRCSGYPESEVKGASVGTAAGGSPVVVRAIYGTE